MNRAEFTQQEKKKKDVSEAKSECPHISAVREEEVQAARTGQTILQTAMFPICIETQELYFAGCSEIQNKKKDSLKNADIINMNINVV